MIEYNNIPNQTDWGDATALVNDNFARTKTKLSQLEALGTTGFKYLGVVNSYSDLPTTNIKDGDAYLVKTGIPVNPQDYPNGEIFVWIDINSPQWTPTGLSGISPNVLNNVSLNNISNENMIIFDGTHWVNRSISDIQIARTGGSAKSIQQIDTDKADKTAVAAADTNLQTQINSIVDNLKPYAEQYDFQIIITPKNTETKMINLGYITSNSDLVVQTDHYTSKYNHSDTKNIWVLCHPNDTINIYSSEVQKIQFSWIEASGIIFAEAKNNAEIELYLVDLTVDSLFINELMKVSRITADRSAMDMLSYTASSNLTYLGCDKALNVKNIILGNVDLLTDMWIQESPKLEEISYYGNSLPNLCSIAVNGTAIPLDKIMKIGNDWTSRVGKDAGKIYLNKSIFDAMTQDQKNVFIYKNINILH